MYDGLFHFMNSIQEDHAVQYDLVSNFITHQSLENSSTIPSLNVIPDCKDRRQWRSLVAEQLGRKHVVTIRQRHPRWSVHPHHTIGALVRIPPCRSQTHIENSEWLMCEFLYFDPKHVHQRVRPTMLIRYQYSTSEMSLTLDACERLGILLSSSIPKRNLGPHHHSCKDSANNPYAKIIHRLYPEAGARMHWDNSVCIWRWFLRPPLSWSSSNWGVPLKCHINCPCCLQKLFCKLQNIVADTCWLVLGRLVFTFIYWFMSYPLLS